ncbi:MAG: hypothetical protein LBQ96_03750 [Fusobacteriaceae bacterium]|jgi:hypothetical protein|nr:hypothetical protein [Fusobacteriaceae bacterium]
MRTIPAVKACEERSFKHFLKKKVSVTLSLLIAFLIAGKLAWGVNPEEVPGFAGKPDLREIVAQTASGREIEEVQERIFQPAGGYARVEQTEPEEQNEFAESGGQPSQREQAEQRERQEETGHLEQAELYFARESRDGFLRLTKSGIVTDAGQSIASATLGDLAGLVRLSTEGIRYEELREGKELQRLNTSHSSLFDAEETLAFMQERLGNYTLEQVRVLPRKGIRMTADGNGITTLPKEDAPVAFDGRGIALRSINSVDILLAAANITEEESIPECPEEVKNFPEEKMSTIGLFPAGGQFPGENARKGEFKQDGRKNARPARSGHKISDISAIRKNIRAAEKVRVPIRIHEGARQSKRSWKQSVDIFVNGGMIATAKGSLSYGEQRPASHGPPDVTATSDKLRITGNFPAKGAVPGPEP